MQQMTRTIGFFLTNIEKRQTLIKSLATLKTENSRLKEMIAAKTDQVNEMTQQLESVAHVERSLHELITSLFSKLEILKKTYSRVHSVLQSQEQQARAMKAVLLEFNAKIDEKQKERDEANSLIGELKNEIHAQEAKKEECLKSEEEMKQLVGRYGRCG